MIFFVSSKLEDFNSLLAKTIIITIIIFFKANHWPIINKESMVDDVTFD